MKTYYTLIPLTTILACSSPSKPIENTSPEEEQIVYMSSFDYVPDEPVNGELMGIIELGYTGFNTFIINIDLQDRWSLEEASYGESFVSSDEATFDRIYEQIRDSRQEMIAYGVHPDNVNLVASSSALRDGKIDPISDRLDQLNIGVITVNATQEGNYALKAAIPELLQETSFMIDIGSGNTKISWVENGTAKSIETIGSRYRLEGYSDQQASYEIKTAIAQVPDAKRNVCFMIGGAPFQLAKQTDNRNSRYTVLESPDSYQFDDEGKLAGLEIYRNLWNESTIYVFDWDSNFAIGVLMDLN